jgi:hypothetical protein
MAATPPAKSPVKPAAVSTAGAVPVTQAATPVAPIASPVPKVVVPPFTIHPLGAYGRWLKGLFYGDYGTGKTRLVGSSVLVPQMRDILFIDCEAGDLTIATEDSKEYNEGAHTYLDVVRAQTFKDLARIQEYLKLHCQYRDQDDQVAGEAMLKKLEAKLMPETFDPDKPARRYRTAIVDSLSEAESFSMYQLLGIKDTTRLDEDVSSPEWAEYKRNHSQILRMVRAYRDLPMNILMTAAAGFIQNELKQMLWQPALTGRLAKQCQGFMDVVGYMYVTTGENNTKIHMMQVQPSPRINAKCRFSNFKLMGWQNPTMLSILTSVGLLEMKTTKVGT